MLMVSRPFPRSSSWRGSRRCRGRRSGAAGPATTAGSRCPVGGRLPHLLTDPWIYHLPQHYSPRSKLYCLQPYSDSNRDNRTSLISSFWFLKFQTWSSKQVIQCSGEIRSQFALLVISQIFSYKMHFLEIILVVSMLYLMETIISFIWSQSNTNSKQGLRIADL